MEADEIVEKMIENMDMQYKKYEESLERLELSKRNLAFVKLAETLERRNDTYYVGITISKSPEEVEKIVGFRSSYTKRSHLCSYLVVVIILPKILQSSFEQNRFRLNVNVSVDHQRLSRTVPVKVNNVLVIPWTEFPLNSELNIAFFGKIEKRTVVYRIPKIVLTLSYFIKQYNNINRNNQLGTYKEKLISISKQYDQTKKYDFTTYSIQCFNIIHADMNLVSILGKAFSTMNNTNFLSERSVELPIYTSIPSHIKLMKSNYLIKVESNAEILWEFKKFLFTENKNYKEFEMLAIREFSKKYGFSKHNVIEFYLFLRGLWNVTMENI